MKEDAGAFKEALREKLWKALVYSGTCEPPMDLLERSVDALAAIEFLREQNEEYEHLFEEQDATDANLAALAGGQKRALAIWALFTADVMSWATEDSPSDYLEVPEEHEVRYEIMWQIAMALTLVPPTHTEHFTRVPLYLRPETARQLLHAFQALGVGETLPMFGASVTRRHGKPWTEDQLRLRAVEHVAFLRGQGITKSMAQRRVFHATDIPPTTLQSWEKRDLPRHVVNLVRHLEIAQGAGAIYAGRQADKDYGRREGDILDSTALAFLKTIEDEPLIAFGIRYRDMRQHWGGVADD